MQRAPNKARLSIQNTSHESFFHENLVSTLNKPPKRRTNVEIDVLMRIAMGKQFFADFHSKYGSSSLRDLLKRCYHEYERLTRFVPEGDILFELGTGGSEFYIILRGECAFFQRPQESEKDGMRELAKQIEAEPVEPIVFSAPRSKASYPGTLP